MSPTRTCGLAGCLTLALSVPAAAVEPTVTSKPFGKTRDGTPVELYTLTNANGMRASVMTFGGILVELNAPDRTGKIENVVLGFDNLEQYLAGHPMFGAIVGRYANRVGGAQFTLDGKVIDVAKNSGKNHIHGGPNGFDKQVWKANAFLHRDGASVQLTHESPDGTSGFPGRLTATVSYFLGPRSLRIEYRATTDKPTVVNLTNHSYFNLRGPAGGDMLGHELQIFADQYTPGDADLIPTGELRPVAGTPLDFRTPVAIGKRIDDPMLTGPKGYDHNYVINRTGDGLAMAARVTEPTTGRVMEVSTTEPGVQLYTANHLNGRLTGPGGVKYVARAGFCLETQHYPDSPNKPQFPSTVLRPGQTYLSTTVFRFSVAK